MNAEADDDPDDVGRQLPGPAGFLATSQWLPDAFSDLRFELHETVAEEDCDGPIIRSIDHQRLVLHSLR